MRIIQFVDATGHCAVGEVVNPQQIRQLQDISSTLQLAQLALQQNTRMPVLVSQNAGHRMLNYPALLAEGKVLAPITHSDPAHLLVSGTGLTHLGSAQSRNAMHAKLQLAEDQLTDSMKMFKMGLQGGKPAINEVGVQPEWFYKGDGQCIVNPGAPIHSPAFALDGGDEVEVVGIYIIGADGTPYRIGYALGNECADHKTEQTNYLFLAHSKLRQCSIGPELLLEALPDNVEGVAKIVRDNQIIWEQAFLSGEANMSHSLDNLEHHHFKYAQFCRPGDIHVHFLGAATLSFSSQIETRQGDRFEISSPVFGQPLCNTLHQDPPTTVSIHSLY